MEKLDPPAETVCMNTESDDVNPDWIPPTQFDAVRVDGDEGRAVADRLARMTGGAPGPIVEEANGNRAVYFLVPVGATNRRIWPPGVVSLASGPSCVAYIPVPALNGQTWPLAWRYRPTGRDHLVHALLLKAALRPEE